MLAWLTKSVWNVVLLIAGVAVLVFLLVACTGGLVAYTLWPQPQTVEVVKTQVVEVPEVVKTQIVEVVRTVEVPDSDLGVQAGSGYLTDGTGYGKENFEAPSHFINAGKPLKLKLEPGIIQFNIACGDEGCPEGVEKNYVAIYDGPVKTVELSEGAGFWFDIAFLDHPDELWRRAQRDSLNDYWPSQLSAELAAIEGLTLLEPQLGYNDPPQ